MSQSGNLSVTLPPGSTLSFATDSGSATPAANVINLVTAGSGALGIETSGAGNTITITLDDKSVTGTATTIGAVTGNVVTFACGATPGTYTFDCRIAGFTTAGGPLGAGYTLVGAVRTTGAAATLITGQAVDIFEEGALSAGDANIIVSGNNAIFQVLGTAATTINWTAIVSYTFAS